MKNVLLYRPCKNSLSIILRRMHVIHAYERATTASTVETVKPFTFLNLHPFQKHCPVGWKKKCEILFCTQIM